MLQSNFINFLNNSLASAKFGHDIFTQLQLITFVLTILCRLYFMTVGHFINCIGHILSSNSSIILYDEDNFGYVEGSDRGLLQCYISTFFLKTEEYHKSNRLDNLQTDIRTRTLPNTLQNF
jgi:hypothetical protein